MNCGSSLVRAVLSMVERLRDDPNIEDADLELESCPTLALRVR